MSEAKSKGFISYFLWVLTLGGIAYGIVALIQFDLFSTKEFIDPKGYFAPWFYVSISFLSLSIIVSLILLLKNEKQDGMAVLLCALVFLFLTFLSAEKYFNHNEFYEKFDSAKWKKKNRSIKMAREIRDQKLLEGKTENELIQKLGTPDEKKNQNWTYFLDSENCQLEISIEKHTAIGTSIPCDFF